MPQPTPPIDALQDRERLIARSLVSAALDAGCLLRVEDEESLAVNWTADPARVMSVIHDTDITRLRVRHPESGDAAFLLVWGNGDDLISDFTDNDLGNALYNRAEAGIEAAAAVERALAAARYQTAPEALEAVANPYAGLLAARRRDGIIDPDLAVSGFEAVPAWATADGRIVTLADPTAEPNPPDLYAVRALTSHPAIATIPQAVEFHDSEEAAREAAARFTDSLAPGAVLSSDQMTADQWLDQALEADLSGTIAERIAAVADNVDLLNPVAHADEGQAPTVLVPLWKAQAIANSASALPDPLMIEARFVPQAWVNDYAVNVDPEGETAFTVPLASGMFLPGEDGVFPEDDQYQTDDLRTHDSAPHWVREWSGPFYVEVTNREDIEAHFEEELDRIAEAETAARGEPGADAQAAQRLLADFGSPEWASAREAAAPLATPLTDRWMEPLDPLSPQDAALVQSALDAVQQAEGDGGSEMTFIAKDADGRVGYLFEFEFDDNAAPTAEMTERFLAFAARHAPDATAIYVEPGGTEVFNGRAAFQAFIPGPAFPARQLDALADYTLAERYRHPDPAAWQGYLADSTARLVNRWMHDDPAMERALAELVRGETYGIADSWAGREQVESMAAHPDLDPDTASILHLRAGLLGGTSEDAARADARWRNEIARRIVSYEPAGDDPANRAVSAVREALFPADAMQGWSLTGGANVIEEPGTGRAVLLWEIESDTDGGASLWVENGQNIPPQGVDIRGSFNAVMGGARVFPGTILDASRVSGLSEIRNGAHLTNARIHNSFVEDSVVRNTKEPRVIAGAVLSGSRLTDCDTQGNGRPRIIHNATATDTSFAGSVELHGGIYEGQVVAGESRSYPLAAPEGPIMVLPKNGKFTLTGERKTIDHDGEARLVFEIEARREVWPSNSDRVAAGERGGWIESPSALTGDGPEVWTASNAWIGRDAYVLKGSTVTGNAAIIGEAEDRPVILDRSDLLGQATVKAHGTIAETRISGVSRVLGAWQIRGSDLDSATLKPSPGGPASNAISVKAKNLNVDDGAHLFEVKASHVIFSGVAVANHSSIEFAGIRDARLDHVEIGPVRFTGEARKVADNRPQQQFSFVSDADLADIRLAPGSTIRGKAWDRASLPGGTMFAGKYDLLSDTPGERAIVMPCRDDMMFTGEWLTTQIPQAQGQEELVFEITALRDIPGRGQPQVQLDGAGNRRGTVPAVMAGELGGCIGRGVTVAADADGAWIEAGAAMTGRARLNDRAFVGRGSHVHDAELNGDTLLIDAVVLDDDTVIGQAQSPRGTQAPVVIGTVLRHSRLADAASVVAPHPARAGDPGRQQVRPTVAGLFLAGTESHSVPTPRESGARLPGRSPEQQAQVRKWRSLIRVMQQRGDGSAQNAQRVRELPRIHDSINERGAAEAQFARIVKDGRVGMIREGMDCDSTQYRRETIIDRPKSLVAFLREEEDHRGWLDGPEATYFVSPDEVCDGYATNRDLALEAFEDGHPHVVHPVTLPSGRDTRPEQRIESDGRRATAKGNETLAFRDLRTSISVDDLAKALSAAQRAEEARDDRAISRYLEALRVRDDGDLRDTLLKLRGSDHWDGMIAQLQALGGSVQIERRTGNMTYRRDPAQDHAARQQQQADLLENGFNVSVSHYRVLAHVLPEDAQANPEGPFTGVLRHRGEEPDDFRQATGRDLVEPVWLRFVGPASHDTPIYAVPNTQDGKPVLDHGNSAVQERLRNPAGLAQRPGPNPATRSAPQGPAPVLYSAERIDGGRVMVRFIAATEPGDDPGLPRFQSAVVPEGGHVEVSALRPPMPSIGAADQTARFMAERDPMFFSRKPEAAREPALAGDVPHPSPLREGPRLG